VFVEALVNRQRHALGFEMDGVGKRAHGGGRVAKTGHRPDVAELRLVQGALQAAPHPVDGGAVAGDEKHGILHGAGEIELVDLAEDRQHPPLGTVVVEAGAQRVQAPFQFGAGDFLKHGLSP
jgi:hypothetical protein